MYYCSRNVAPHYWLKILPNNTSPQFCPTVLPHNTAPQHLPIIITSKYCPTILTHNTALHLCPIVLPYNTSLFYNTVHMSIMFLFPFKKRGQYTIWWICVFQSNNKPGIAENMFRFVANPNYQSGKSHEVLFNPIIKSLLIFQLLRANKLLIVIIIFFETNTIS